MTEQQLLLKPLEFSKILSRYTLIPHHLNVLSTKGNLNQKILDIQMSGYYPILEGRGLWKSGVTKEQVEKTKQDAIEKLKAVHQVEIKNYMPILFNEALVMLCMVFDNFLCDTLGVLIEKKPNILKGLSQKDDVEISEIIDLADYQKIFNSLQQKILKRFDFKSIDKKISAFRGLGLEMDWAFQLKLRTEDVQKQYKKGYAFLLEIYEKRHVVAHKNLLPLKSYDELESISIYLDYLMTDLAVGIGIKFDIPTDFEITLRLNREELERRIDSFINQNLR